MWGWCDGSVMREGGLFLAQDDDGVGAGVGGGGNGEEQQGGGDGGLLFSRCSSNWEQPDVFIPHLQEHLQESSRHQLEVSHFELS